MNKAYLQIKDNIFTFPNNKNNFSKSDNFILIQKFGELLFQNDIPAFPTSKNIKYTVPIRITNGCEKSKQCGFCNLYKDFPYRILSLDDIKDQIDTVFDFYKRNKLTIDEIFLLDANPLIADFNIIKEVFIYIYHKLNRYANPYENEVFNLIYVTENSDYRLDQSRDFARVSKQEYFELAGLVDKLQPIPIISTFAQVNTILKLEKENKLKELKEMGLKEIHLGIESGSDEFLQMMQKGCYREDIINSCNILKKYNISIVALILTGIELYNNFNHTYSTKSLLDLVEPNFISFSRIKRNDKLNNLETKKIVKILNDEDSENQEKDILSSLSYSYILADYEI